MQLVAHEAHSLIEEFMILANSIIANFLCEKYVFVPLRVQKTPDVGLLVDWFEKHQPLKSILFGFDRYLSCLKGSVDVKFDTCSVVVELKNLSVIKPIFDKILSIRNELVGDKHSKQERCVLIMKLQYLLCNEHNYPLIANASNDIREIMDPAEYMCVNTEQNRKYLRHFSVNLQNYTHFL
jgi:hypothetical protein